MKSPLPKLVPACLLFPFIVFACSRTTQSPENRSAAIGEPPAAVRISSVDVVRATAEPAEISAGSSAQAMVRLTIRPGYHVNANPPTYSYLKATELEVPASEGVSLGFITYPTPTTRKFSFAEKPLVVYEGETSIKLMLKADKSAKKGSRYLSARLRIQACDDQVCYPPGQINVSLPVTIK